MGVIFFVERPYLRGGSKMHIVATILWSFVGYELRKFDGDGMCE